MMKNMKNILILIAAVFIYSCDTVEGPFIEKTSFDCNYDSELPIRKILIEDFTGWKCTNCPQAAQEIEDLKNRYPCHIVGIGVHAGFFANLIIGDPDFTTDIGFELGGNGNDDFGFFEVLSQPTGVINRISRDGDYKLDYSTWGDNVVALLEEDVLSDIGIEIETDFDDASKELTVDVSTKTYGEVDAKLSLIVYLTESHIIAPQENGSELDENYEHNHVLRAGLNGTWGEEISTTTPVLSNTTFNNSLSFTFADEWVPDNCEVIVIISNTETKEIIQVEEHGVISND